MFVLIHNAIRITECSSPLRDHVRETWGSGLDCLITNARAVASGSKWRHVVCLYLCQWYVSVRKKKITDLCEGAFSIVRT